MALITTPTNLDYLITPLRLLINDNNTPYTYSDDELRTRIVFAVSALMPRWNFKYLLDVTYNVYRNPNITYLFPEPPVVQNGDERPIILQAAIDITSATLQTLSATAVSWKDDEVSYSNRDSILSLQSSLARFLAELESILPIPRMRLAQPSKQSLPGFTHGVRNIYEG